MAVTALHTLYAVDYDGGLIDQISDWGYDVATAELLKGGDGQVDPTFVCVGQQEPAIRFTTTGIAKALAVSGISGVAIASDALFTAYMQQMAEGGTRTAGANHITYVISQGILVPEQINASTDDAATISYVAHATYDSSNLPVIIAGSQSLTGTPSTSEIFYCGPVKVNGQTINGVQNVTIDFGITVYKKGGDGLAWPSFVCISTRQPSITVTTLDAGFGTNALFTTSGLAGIAQSTTDSVVYLRKADEGGTRTADATEEHISFTIDEGRLEVSSVQGSHGEALGATIKITPTWDATAAIMAIDTTAAIA